MASKNRRLAIVSLVCSIIGGTFSTFSIPGIICGHVALRKINKLPEAYGGKGIAIAGVILGYVGLILAVVTGVLRAMVKQKLQGLQ